MKTFWLLLAKTDINVIQRSTSYAKQTQLVYGILIFSFSLLIIGLLSYSIFFLSNNILLTALTCTLGGIINLVIDREIIGFIYPINKNIKVFSSFLGLFILKVLVVLIVSTPIALALTLFLFNKDLVIYQVKDKLITRQEIRIEMDRLNQEQASKVKRKIAEVNQVEKKVYFAKKKLDSLFKSQNFKNDLYWQLQKKQKIDEYKLGRLKLNLRARLNEQKQQSHDINKVSNLTKHLKTGVLEKYSISIQLWEKEPKFRGTYCLVIGLLCFFQLFLTLIKLILPRTSYLKLLSQ